MKRSILLLAVAGALLISSAHVMAAALPRVPLVAKAVTQAPVLDGNPGDAAWQTGFRYPLIFNQLKEADQVFTDQSDLMVSFRLVWTADGKLYGVAYRQDNADRTDHGDSYQNDGIELFFDLDHSNTAVVQLRTVIGNDFEADKGLKPKAVWSKDNKVCEFVVDLAAAGVKVGPDAVIGFNIAINDNDEGSRKTQLYPFPGNNTSYNTPSSLGDLVFK